MNVLLINPQNPAMVANREFCPPPSILYLAAVLLRDGIDVNILDLNIASKEDVVNQIENQQPNLVGIGCLFSGQFPTVMACAKVVKECDNIPVVIGGIHPTNFPAEILANCPDVDYVVCGEGEVALLELARMIRKNDLSDLATIDGFAYRNGSEVVVHPKKHYIANLDELPMPAYDLINLKDYYHDTSNWHNPRNLPINASLSILSSRGCPFQCNFCSMYTVMSRRWRARTPSKVVDEIEFLYNTYGHRHFSFMDDNLTFDKAHALGVCNEIVKRGLYIQFETPNGVATKTLDVEVMDALVEAGLVRLTLAIESGSDYIRERVMGKPLKRDKIYEVVALTKQYPQLYTRAFFLMGMPEDTPETLEETYRMIQDIDIEKPCMTNVIPFPHTRLFDQCLRDNLFVDEFDLNALWKSDAFYYTGNKKFFIKPYKMSLEELGEWRERFDVLIEGIRR